MDAPNRPLYYADYLALDRLLGCQELESARHGTPAHDEMLFIIVHQAYELWFKQILWELDAVLRLFGGETVDEMDVARSVAHLERIVAIQRVLLQHIDILETMTPLDFLEFRNYLIPASGFQSVQFRLIENRMGLRPQDRVRFSEAPYTSRLKPGDRARLEASEKEPSLFDRIERWLERTPFLHFGDFDFWQAYREAVDRMLERERRHLLNNPALTPEEREKQLRGLEATATGFEALFDPEKHRELVARGVRRLSHRALLAALLIHLYRHKPILHLPFRLLSLLVDIDENFTTWRYRHALMAQRMIGTRIGTGGSSGHDYLRQAAERNKVFTDLVNLSTYFIPRSALPELPPEVERTMGFQYAGTSG
ncbi:MAG: tryptophan 2,3-dioxygenase [Rhodothermaceae bacterium]|nr:MAG: tryptophan 2,3-dioxygenase [Rhodothermaceae bacterium]